MGWERPARPFFLFPFFLLTTSPRLCVCARVRGAGARCFSLLARTKTKQKQSKKFCIFLQADRAQEALPVIHVAVGRVSGQVVGPAAALSASITPACLLLPPDVAIADRQFLAGRDVTGRVKTDGRARKVDAVVDTVKVFVLCVWCCVVRGMDEVCAEVARVARVGAGAEDAKNANELGVMRRGGWDGDGKKSERSPSSIPPSRPSLSPSPSSTHLGRRAWLNREPHPRASKCAPLRPGSENAYSLRARTPGPCARYSSGLSTRQGATSMSVPRGKGMRAARPRGKGGGGRVCVC
jgi:hypothetical protein